VLTFLFLVDGNPLLWRKISRLASMCASFILWLPAIVGPSPSRSSLSDNLIDSHRIIIVEHENRCNINLSTHPLKVSSEWSIYSDLRTLTIVSQSTYDDLYNIAY
jgi:hypothetical protein